MSSLRYFLAVECYKFGACSKCTLWVASLPETQGENLTGPVPTLSLAASAMKWHCRTMSPRMTAWVVPPQTPRASDSQSWKLYAQQFFGNHYLGQRALDNNNGNSDQRSLRFSQFTSFHGLGPSLAFYIILVLSHWSLPLSMVIVVKPRHVHIPYVIKKLLDSLLLKYSN